MCTKKEEDFRWKEIVHMSSGHVPVQICLILSPSVCVCALAFCFVVSCPRKVSLCTLTYWSCHHSICGPLHSTMCPIGGVCDHAQNVLPAPGLSFYCHRDGRLQDQWQNGMPLAVRPNRGSLERSHHILNIVLPCSSQPPFFVEGNHDYGANFPRCVLLIEVLLSC